MSTNADGGEAIESSQGNGLAGQLTGLERRLS